MAFRIATWAAVLVVASAPSAIAQVYRYEAENGQLFGINTSSSTAGYSGSGYVTGFDVDTDHLSVQVNVPDGLYELWVGYNSPYGHKGYGVQADSEIGDGSFDDTGNQFRQDRAGIFNLTGATNTLQILKSWGYYNVDYLELRPATIQAPSPIAPILSDPNANNRTQYLMNYLSSIYGVKRLSGQQGSVGSNSVFPSSTYLTKSGGLTPAVRGSDFIEYSPSRISHGSNPNGETERIINWAKQTGGIPTMMWHWNAPTDLIDTPGKEWWRGFYTDSTTFDVQAALASPGSPKYNLLLSDIDSIAVQLKKFQDAGVPVLWRPLHEAEGKWFWWGAKGPDAFKGLWNLMYDRLTNVNGLHNLIWVYTSSPADQGYQDWYPGDDKVDIVGLDVYTNASSSMSGQWLDIREAYNGRKMVTLSETGTLPNASVMRERGIDWSWFSPWSINDVVNNYSAAQLQALLGDSDVITLNELPLMPWNILAPPPGDFSRDGIVNAADYSIWRDTMGQTGTGLAADGNANNQIDVGDYDIWRANFGNSASGTATGSAVPEPTSILLLGIAIIAGLTDRKWRLA
jgi:mannan endo-1,4-beta-mannosidase